MNFMTPKSILNDLLHLLKVSLLLQRHLFVIQSLRLLPQPQLLEPQPAQNLEIIPTNITHIVFEFNVPNDSDNCKVQRTTNLSKGWFNQEILSPCLKGTYEYEHLNPEPNSRYFYRILIETHLVCA